MRSTTNGGLVLIASAGAEAANEEPAAAERLVPAKEHREESTTGWDPYEVWRTRVKEPRMVHDESPPSEPHERG